MPTNNLYNTSVNAPDTGTAHYYEYKLRPGEDPVLIQVFPGATGQSALTKVMLEGSQLELVAGPLANFAVGSNDGLLGKMLDVETVITIMPGCSNSTTFHIEIDGGAQPYFYDMSKTLNGPNESVIYKMSILFVNR